MSRRRNMGFLGGSGTGAPWSWAGLILFLVTFGGGVLWAQHEASKGGFHGFAGFLVMAVWLWTLPASFILGIIGLARKEKPIALPLSVMVLCALPVLYLFWLIAKN